MYISEIGLYQFRNYDNINIKLHPKLNILYGNNAQGKTNILEAIYICATARSIEHLVKKRSNKMGKGRSSYKVIS